MDLSGLAYFIMIPVGIAAGLAVSLAIVLVAGPTWFAVVPPLLGGWIGGLVARAMI